MFLATTLLLALSASPVPACTPADDPALVARVAPLLGSIDRPVSDGQWRALPPGAREYLALVAEDPTAFPARRARALEGLAAIGGDAAVHQRLATDPAAPYAVRHSAIRGLAALVPPERASQALAPLLTADRDLRVRATAADALGRAAPSAGCPSVRAQVQREGSDARRAYRRALQACGDR
jgi:HEAT repeat protein